MKKKIIGSSIFKFECKFCDFKSNSKKKFSEHRSSQSHIDAVKKIQEHGL